MYKVFAAINALFKFDRITMSFKIQEKQDVVQELNNF